MTATGKRKIAVLGGGAGSMGALWALTSLPNAADRFDITVYQMGWRLGGKGASGRNAAYGHRIEEHGLHVWGGFYRNAFRMMREIYAAQPDDGRLFKQWSDAFKRHSAVQLEEKVNGAWIPWPIELPEDPENDPDSDPTSGGELPPPGEYIHLILDALEQLFDDAREEFKSEPPPQAAIVPGGWLQRVRQEIGVVTEDVAGIVSRETPHALVVAARDLAALLPGDPNLHSDLHLSAIVNLIIEADESSKAISATLAGRTDRDRRLTEMISLVRATIDGLIRDDVLRRGFESINDLDWTVWMAQHGASTEAQQSAMVRGIYDYVFGYENGMGDRPSLEAGTAVNGILRLFFTFKGSLFWEMQAGMGDVVFAPTYEVLKARGVTFKFFHRIEQLLPDATRTAVDSIVVRQQAAVKNGSEYQPLITINQVPSWPSQPDLDQLIDGASYADVNFESAWSVPTGTVQTLRRGVDFDDVILGISLEGVKHVCKDLPAAGSPFQQMLDNLQTVQTCSMQLWLTPAADGVGAPAVPRIGSCYVDNLNTFSDMSFLLARETWPASAPQYIGYFCGQLPDAATIPPFTDTTFPAQQMARMKQESIAWIEANLSTIWTKFQWAQLYDGSNASGAARLDSQYLRVNIDPSERYVLSLPGTSKYRLRAGQSGFTNLFFTGDWVRTSINAGCVEAAVMAGMDAASALSGDPIPIVGGLA